MADLPESLSRLIARLDELEQRVTALECSPSPISLAPAVEPTAAPAAVPDQAKPTIEGNRAFAVVGRAMLGIAGAYLLRAVAESDFVPKSTVAGVAIAYAITWLVWGARARSGSWFPSSVYACTSSLILAPMLWELTMRFKVMSASTAAFAVGLFASVAFVLVRKPDQVHLLRIANIASGSLCLALAIATHVTLPFIGVLLLMVAFSEYAMSRERPSAARLFVAFAADLAVWIFVYIYSSPQSTRPDYPSVTPFWLLLPGLALFLIFAASIFIKIILLRRKITAFETLQTTIAFAIVTYSFLLLGPTASRVILGILCLALSVVVYVAVFKPIECMHEPFNTAVFASWSAALFLAGNWLFIPTSWMPASMGLAAVASTVAGSRMRRLALEFHGALYLLIAAAASGLSGYVVRVATGMPKEAPPWGIDLVSGCAVICYVAVNSYHGDLWQEKALHLVSACLAICSVTALMIHGLATLTSLVVHPATHHLAFIRTLMLCAVALALAFSGARWRRLELTRLGFAVLVLLALKLVAEDLRHGHLGYTAASICLVAITLIAVPRVGRIRPAT
ncbi:MAG: hypothetical protein ACLPH3_16740 [Terracidiphilus sp.]